MSTKEDLKNLLNFFLFKSNAIEEIGKSDKYNLYAYLNILIITIVEVLIVSIDYFIFQRIGYLDIASFNTVKMYFNNDFSLIQGFSFISLIIFFRFGLPFLFVYFSFLIGHILKINIQLSSNFRLVGISYFLICLAIIPTILKDIYNPIPTLVAIVLILWLFILIIYSYTILSKEHFIKSTLILFSSFVISAILIYLLNHVFLISVKFLFRS